MVVEVMPVQGPRNKLGFDFVRLESIHDQLYFGPFLLQQTVGVGEFGKVKLAQYQNGQVNEWYHKRHF